jgi:hypothetical protein
MSAGGRGVEAAGLGARRLRWASLAHHWRPIRSLMPLPCAFLRGFTRDALDGDRHTLENA